MADTISISELTGIRSYEEYQKTRAPKNELGRNEFLALLAAQLQYQDPLSPMQDTDFIAQLAQFSALQQMESLTTIMTTYQYYSLVGKFVYAEVRLDTGEEVAISGIVDRVVTQNGKAFAQIGDYMVDCSKISQVLDKDIFAGNKALLENTSLIGKYIKAEMPGENEGETVTVSGICVRVTIEDNTLVAYLDSGKKVPLGYVYDIAAQAPEPEIQTPPPPAESEDPAEDAEPGTGE